jgi:hypothetical protein
MAGQNSAGRGFQFPDSGCLLCPPGRGICPSQRLHLHRTTETPIISDIQQCPSGIRTHDPRVRAIGNRKQPSSRGQFVKHPKWTKTTNNATIRQNPLLDHLVKDNLKQIDADTRSGVHVYTDGADSIGILAQTQTGFCVKQATVEWDLCWVTPDLTLMRWFCTWRPVTFLATLLTETHTNRERFHWSATTQSRVSKLKPQISTLPIRQTHDMSSLK